jgi:hypothetical protein
MITRRFDRRNHGGCPPHAAAAEWIIGQTKDRPKAVSQRTIKLRTMSALLLPKLDVGKARSHVRFGPILLQKSFWEVGLKFSGPYVQRLNNDAGDHVTKR